MGVGLVALGPAELEPLVPRLAVAAEGREPDAQARVIAAAQLGQGREAVGETAVELPERLGIVPAVVEDHGVDDHAALLDQVVAAEANRLQAVRLVQGEGIPGDVVPGVVVQEGAVGMGPFALEVI